MALASPAFKKKEKADAHAEGAPGLALVTFQPIGNPLEGMADQERRFFFDTLFRMLRVKTAENVDMARQIAGRNLRSVSLARQPAHFISHEEAGGNGAISWKKATVLSPEVETAQEVLAASIAEYARGDAALGAEILSEFESRLRSQGYKADDLMAVLLLVIEDHHEAAAHGGAGDSSSKPFQAAARAEILPPEESNEPQPKILAAKLVPKKLQDLAREAVEVRLASVREMLRYYFVRNPKEYEKALSKLLAIPISKAEPEYVQSRLASELADIGALELAQGLLNQVKSQKEMDTTKCLLELGYRFDGEKKRLILGKRTCGNRQQAAGILQLLLSKSKGKKMAERDAKPPRMLSAQQRKPAAPD